MIDLYAMGSPNVVKIYIALEEMGLPYTVHPVDFFGEEQFKLEFLKLNPNAKVPVITDHDGAGRQALHALRIGGDPALPRREDRAVSAQRPGRKVRRNPVDDGADDLGRPDVRAVCALHALRAQRERLRVRPLPTQVRRVLATLEERLGVAPFLGGQSYSIADIATFPWARGVGTFLGKPAEAEYPKLMAWAATINSRSEVARALAAVDGVRAKTTQFDKAGEGAKDRLFGRGRYAA